MMKKLLLMAAAAFTAWSCTADIEEIAPSTGDSSDKYYVTVGMPAGDDATTRISFTEDAESGALNTLWTWDDALIGWSEGSETLYPLYMDTIADDYTSAMFYLPAYMVTGDIPASMRLVYPYEAGSGIVNNEFTVSFADQAANMSDATLTSLASSTYMVSTPASFADGSSYYLLLEEEPTMQHACAVIEVGMQFSELASSELKISSITVGGGDGKTIPVEGYVDLTKGATEDGFTTATKYGQIAALATNASAVVEGETYKVRLNTLPFTMSADQSLELQVVLSDDANSYTKTFSITAPEKISFARATYTQANYACDMTDAAVTEKVDAIKVVETDATALMINLGIEVNYDVCDGYAWTSYSTSYAQLYAGYLESDIKNNYATIYTDEDGLIAVGSDYYLDPNSSYTIEIFAVKGSEEAGYSAYGEAITFAISTAEAIIGASDVTVEIEIDDSKTSLTGFGGYVYNNEDAGGYWTSNVACSELSSMDAAGVKAYIEANGLLASAYASSFYGIDYSTYEYVDAEYKTFSASSKVAGTDYIAFAVAVDNYGNYGEIAYATVTTTSLNIDASLLPEVTVVPGNTSADFTFKFNNCYKVFRMNGAVGSSWTTVDTAYSYFLGDLTSLYYGWAADGTTSSYDGTYSEDMSEVYYTQTNLSMSTDYNMFYLGVAEDGTLGEMQTLTYTTTSPSFGASTATVEATLSGQAYYWYDPADYPNYTDSLYADVDVEVTMSNGATSYIYGVFDKAYVTNQDSTSAFASYLIGTYYNPITTSATSLSALYFGSSTYVLTIVPVDADGAYGTPIVCEFDGWDSPIVEGEDTSSGGGISPLAL